jgi:hypothetical protein
LGISSEYLPLGIHRLISPVYGLPVRELTQYDFNRIKQHKPEDVMIILWEEREYHGKLKLEIDLFNSKYKLLKIIDNLIAEHQSIMKKKHGEDFERMQAAGLRKPRYNNFDNYLAVYDLRKEGRSSNVISQALGLNGPYMVRDYFNVASKLVKKGLQS